MNQNIITLLKKAEGLQSRGQHGNAIEVYNKVLAKDRANYIAQFNKAISLINLHSYPAALSILEGLFNKKTDDLQLIKVLASLYGQLLEYGKAMQLLKNAIKDFPNDFDLWTELTKNTSKLGRYQDSVYYATQALSIDPTNSYAHNNLGGALLSLNRIDDALFCFETSILLSNNNISAITNLATTFEKKGYFDRANKLYEEILATSTITEIQRQEILYKKSMSLLGVGDLKRGWDLYDFGLFITDPRSRLPKREFLAPKWDGHSHKNSTLLIWREQGLGDELRFYSVLNEVEKYFKNVIIECDRRLVTLIQRSFPNYLVREDGIANNKVKIPLREEDFDFQIPCGSLMKYFRNDISLFKRNNPFLSPNKQLNGIFKQRITNFPGKLKIGLSWRSGVVDSMRAPYYASLDQFQKFFDSDDHTFVNLQYDISDNEREINKRLFNSKLILLDDVDLRDDLESLVSIISNLDLVITPGTSLCSIAEGCGIKTKMFYPGGWILLNSNNYPWSKTTSVYLFDSQSGPKTALDQIKSDIDLLI